MLTQSELKEILDYNSNIGIFIWKSKRQGIKNNLIAGYKNKEGYIIIKINGKSYKAHRLAWLYVYGYYPENNIDHINRNGYDNKISNLREVSQQCNMRNVGNLCNNKSGVKGVGWHKRDEKWYVNIKINKKIYHIGNFDNFDEAVCHRLAAEQCLNWSGCDSNSPAYQYIKNNIQ